MPTPAVLTFTSQDGVAFDLSRGVQPYEYLMLSANVSAPQLEVDVVKRIQRPGISINYTSVGKREFDIDLLIRGSASEESQERYNALLAEGLLSVGGSDPRWGVLTFDGFGASSSPLSIRCAIEGAEHIRIGHSIQAKLHMTCENGIWYSATRITTAPQRLSLGNNLPQVGVNQQYPGTPLPWSMGAGTPISQLDIDYQGTAESRSLIATVTGPSLNPFIRRGDIKVRFIYDLPAGLSLRISMADDEAHQLLGSQGEILEEVTATGDSVKFSLAPGLNQIFFGQQNQIDGTYNTVVYSYLHEYISLGV